MKFSPRELELILRALKNYQIHGAAITVGDYQVASDLMDRLRERIPRLKTNLSENSMVQELATIALTYERSDTQQAFYSEFADWNAALDHAWWVVNSPELSLLKLETSLPLAPGATGLQSDP